MFLKALVNLICNVYLVCYFQQDDDDESDDSELSDFDLDETTLETYLTPIDDEDCDNPIDEYITFQEVINRKLNIAYNELSMHHLYCKIMS